MPPELLTFCESCSPLFCPRAPPLHGAVSPSPSARTAAGPLSRRPSPGSKAIKLMRLTKSATLNGLAKRAVPSVGITWLGPAT